MNPWTDSFEQYRQEVLGETKKKSDKKSSERWQDDDCDGKWYEKSDTDGKISDREKKAKDKKYAKEGIEDVIARLEKKRISKGGDAKDSPLPSMRKYHEKKKKKEAKEGYQRDPEQQEKERKTSKQSDPSKDNFTGISGSIATIMKQNAAMKKAEKKKEKKESVEVNHIDGSKTQIIDVIRAPKMPSAAPLDEMIDGSKAAIGLTGLVFGSGLELARRAKNAAGRLKEKMKKRTQIGEKYSNWREDFIWEGPATAKDPKLDVKETGVKNKIEVNPEVKTEEKKNLIHTSPLTDRVLNWSKTKKTEDYHRGQGEKIQKRTKKWMGKQNPPIEGAPGLDAIKAREAEHRKNRRVKKEEVELDERLGGKGYSKKATGGGGDWEDSDRGAGNKATRRSGGTVKAKSPTYIAHVVNKKKKVTEAKKKKDDTYLETDWEKRKENNEKARKDLQKGPQMKNPHLESRVKYYSGDDRDEKTGYPKGLKSSGGSKKEKDSMTADQRRQMKVEATSYKPKFSVFDEAADRKMSRATDQQLADAHKKFSGMDQSSPANAHMTKRITREINRRKKAAKSAQGSSPVKEEVGVSSSASIKKAKQEAELQRKEALAKKKKGVKEHHQKDSNGKVIEHGDGTPSSVEENVVIDTAKKMGRNLGNKAKEFWNRPIMAPTITKDQHLQKIRKHGGNPSHWQNSYEPEGEVVTELNRYEKETGKSSGSMNMPKGKKTKKGGDSSEVMRSVRTSIRRETGKPAGQRKTREKGEKTPDMKGPSAKLQRGISKLKAKRELDAKARKAGYKSTQDYIEVQARYPD